MSMKLAVEIDGNEIGSPISLDPPYGVRILYTDEWVAKAKEELSHGTKHGRTTRPVYFVAEWTQHRGTAGRLIEWLEDKSIPVTRYAELYE